MFQLGLAFMEAGRHQDASGILIEFVNRIPDHEDAPAARTIIEDIESQAVYNRFTIGCLLPLSGPYRDFGVRALNGIELAFNRFNRLFPESPLQLLIKDSKGDDATAQAAVKAFAEERVAAIIGPIVAAETAAAEAQASGIPIVTLSQKTDITSIGGYVFRNFITPQLQVHAIVDYTVNQLGLKRFVILYPDENYGATFMRLFWDAVTASGGQVVGVESYALNQTDFANPIKKLVGLFYPVPRDLRVDPIPPVATVEGEVTEMELKEKEPDPIVDFDAVFIPDAPNKAGLIIPQLLYYDVEDVYLLGTNLWHSEDLLRMTTQFSKGAIIPDGFFARSTRGTVQEFVDGYEDIYMQTPGFIDAVSYDTATILLNTVARPDIRFRSSINQALRRLKGFPGATGLTTFDDRGEAQKELFLLGIKRKRFVELNQQ
jgi:ABC-type branched-subunit amino acid transport system substrate-binding protein